MFLRRIANFRRQYPGLSVSQSFLLMLRRLITGHLVDSGVLDASGFMAVRRLKEYNSREVSVYRQLVAVSGFGYSGSGAVLDLLSEYEDTTVVGYVDPDGSLRKGTPGQDYEVGFLRGTFGLFGIERIVGSPFFADGNAYIHQFISSMAFLYYEVGGCYASDEFVALVREFLESVLAFKIEGGGTGLSFGGAAPSIGNRWSRVLWGSERDFSYGLRRMSVGEYRAIASKLICGVLSMIPSKSRLVLDQLVSDGTGEIAKYIEYLKDVKVIASHRDPRDVYASARQANARWMPVDVDEFAMFYRTANEGYFNSCHQNLLSIRFEDLILHYDDTVAGIEAFIGADHKNHNRARSALDPSVSRRNVGLWRTVLESSISNRIAELLPEYCYSIVGHL